MRGERDDEERPEDLFEDLDSFFGPEGSKGPSEPGDAGEGSVPRSEPATPSAPGAEDDEGLQDWRRLRDALGDEGAEGDEEIGPEPADVPLGPGLFDEDEADLGEMAMTGGAAWPGPEAGDEDAEDLPELSLDDLKKAPPEYRELPIGADKRERDDASMFESGPDVWTAGPATAAQGEPSLADVEAAADQLAEEFRAGPDDDILLALDRPLEEERPAPRRIKVGEPESLMGPTWEEPSSRAIMGEPEAPRPSGRDVPAAIITAAGLAVLALITVLWRPWAFSIVAGVVVLVAQAELYATMKRRAIQPATALGLVVGGLVLAGAYFRGEQGMLLFVALALMGTMLWFMSAAPKARAGLMQSVGGTLFGVLYVPFLAAFVLLILIQQNSGENLMLAVLGLTFWYDIAAFAIGTLWGSRPLAPTISPKKSWEGLLGATIATFAVAIAILPSIDIVTPTIALELAAVVVVFAPLGDLAESAIKRDLGVKDMGSILPGHGGMLDRVDSALFVAPAAFYFFRLVF
jgi:phosphatidate cytidylyltransferase